MMDTDYEFKWYTLDEKHPEDNSTVIVLIKNYSNHYQATVRHFRSISYTNGKKRPCPFGVGSDIKFWCPLPPLMHGTVEYRYKPGTIPFMEPPKNVLNELLSRVNNLENELRKVLLKEKS
jgi:hypothetical protein